MEMELPPPVPDQQQQQQQQQQENPIPTRWEIELEFVQSLANLQYLNYLAQNRFLQDENFLRYLSYLEYWRQPQYAKFLIYPNCLHVLTLLQNKEFRAQILRQDIVGVIMNDMNERWREDLGTEVVITANGEGDKGKVDDDADKNGNDKVVV